MEKIKLLLYCTKNKYRLFYDYIDNKYRYGLDGKKDKFNAFNGKIVAECVFEVEEIECKISIGTNGIHDEYTTKSLGENELLFASKIDEITFINYLKGKNGYAIHLKNLHIFDMPRELFNYETQEIWNNTSHYHRTIMKAPQNMMYAYEILTGAKYILISIRPEWLCKILNGEKTIEVRKKVLKEMITDA